MGLHGGESKFAEASTLYCPPLGLQGIGTRFSSGAEDFSNMWPAMPLKRPGPAMKLVGPLAARSPGLRLALALEIERHCSADEILQGRLIDLVAFMDVDGAPGIPVEAGVEQT